MLEPGDVLVDCTGSRSLLRDHLTPGSGGVNGGSNTLKFRLEYALVITFLYGQKYDCNEYCKYYKNIENAQYKFIPMVQRTHYDGSVSHVSGIVNITAEDYESMPSRFDGEWLRSNRPGVAESMDRFIDKIKQETQGEILGDLEIVSDTPGSVPGAECHQPAMADSGLRRAPLRQLAGIPCRRFCHRIAVLPVDLARLRMCDVHGWDSSRSAICHWTRCSIGTSCTSTNSGFASTCAAR